MPIKHIAREDCAGDDRCRCEETSAPAPDKITLCDPCAEHHAEHCDSPYTCRDIERVLAHWKAEAERLRLNQEADAILIYSKATGTAMLKGQTVGEQNDYYITLAQLENIIAELRRSRGTEK